MPEANFSFDDCLLKHYVRTKGWLPHCKARRAAVNKGLVVNDHRRLRYFTFCAIGAIDVLMLDVAKVLRPSSSGKFDTVVFFDKDPDDVRETQKRIPGAIGFPGSFTEIVLADGPNAVAEEDRGTHLAAPDNEQDTAVVRKKQLAAQQRLGFIKAFPFDIINLDLQDFFFKANDPFPGQIMAALRKVFAWQRSPLFAWPERPTKSIMLDGFTLMFTTQIGPPNISAEYTDMLHNSLQNNIQAAPDLQAILTQRTGIVDVATLRETQFDEFFKIGLPKILAGLLMEADWFIDPAKGVTIFEFSRQYKGGNYKMLHLIMDVKRQEPRSDKRPPLSGTPAIAQAAYSKVIHQIFREASIEVTAEFVADKELQPSLKDIKARRKKYFPEEDA